MAIGSFLASDVPATKAGVAKLFGSRAAENLAPTSPISIVSTPMTPPPPFASSSSAPPTPECNKADSEIKTFHLTEDLEALLQHGHCSYEEMDGAFNQVVAKHGGLPANQRPSETSPPSGDFTGKSKEMHEIEGAISGQAQRLGSKLETKFRRYLVATNQQGNYKDLGRNYEAQRSFKLKWLQLELKMVTRVASFEEAFVSIV